MDEERPRQALGAPRRRGPKGRNEAKQNRAANQNQELVLPRRISLPDFEDATLTTNWSLTDGMVDDVIQQVGRTCGTLCITRLLQATYNKDKVVAEHLVFSPEDLDAYMVEKTNDSSLKNKSIAFSYVFERGILKKSDTGRRSVGGPGFRGKAQFEEKEDATGAYVYEKATERPIAICLQTTYGFELVGEGIYDVPGNKNSEHKANHAVLVVGVGETSSKKKFLVVQNSWGEKWGKQGYGRIHLKDEDKFDIFWADKIVK